MPRIQPYKPQVSPAAGVGAVRANPAAMSDAGAEQLGRGMMIAGRALNQVADDLDVLQGYMDRVELSEAARRRDELMVDTFRRIAEEPDYTQHERMFHEALAQLDELGPKSRRAANAYRLQNNDLQAYWKSKLNSLTTSRKIRVIAAENTVDEERGAEMLRDAIREGREDDAVLARQRALDAIARSEEMGLYTPKQAQAAREKLDLIESRERAWTTALGAESLDEGLAAIRGAEGLSAREKEALENGFRTEWNRRQADARIAKLQAAEQAEAEVFQKLVDGSLQMADITSFVESGVVDAETGYRWTQRLAAYQETRAKGERDPFLVTDPRVELKLRLAILNGEEVTPQAIYDVVGKGLSLQTANTLVNTLEERRSKRAAAERVVFDRPVVKRALEQIEARRRAGYFWITGGGDEDDWKDKDFEAIRVNDAAYNNILSDFEAWCRENPDATDSDVYAKLESLLYPQIQKDAVDNVSLTFGDAAWLAVSPLIGGGRLLWKRWRARSPEVSAAEYWQGLGKSNLARDVIANLGPAERVLWEQYKARGGTPEGFVKILQEQHGQQD